jgi:hypothetical protein
MADTRRLERFDLEMPATIESLTSDQEEKALLTLLTTNISSGGAYFHTTQPLPEGTQVKIDLVLPLDKLRKLKEEHKKAYIKVTGKVLRTEAEGMAVCFDEDYQIMGSGKLKQHS